MDTYVELNTSRDETFYTAGYNEIFAVKGDVDLVTINLYGNFSDKNVLYKDIRLVKSVEGIFRDDVSLLEPSIILEIDMATLSNINYIYIPIFNRYYYITESVIIRKNLVELNCYIDVLMSYNNYIMNQTALVDRSYNNGDKYIDDNNIVVYPDYNIVQNVIEPIVKFSSGYSLVLTGFNLSDSAPL